MKFVIAGLLIMTAGMLFRGGISFGGEDALACALIIYGAVTEVSHADR